MKQIRSFLLPTALYWACVAAGAGARLAREAAASHCADRRR